MYLCLNDLAICGRIPHKCMPGNAREARWGSVLQPEKEAAVRMSSAVAAAPFTHRATALLVRRWAARIAEQAVRVDQKAEE